jgi:FkbM family methyltransferase
MSDIQWLAQSWGYAVETFFDVGANVGKTALAALQRFPDVHVYSFEPHPSTFSNLRQRIGTGRKFSGENVALGLAVGNVDMFEYDDSVLNSLASDAPFAVRYRQKGRRIQVCCTTLSTYCREKAINRIDVLKIDTEGYDLAVLQGAEEMLANGAIRFVYVEFNDLQAKMGTTGGALCPMDEFLRRFGFRFIASYNEHFVAEGEFFAVSNALFAAPPRPTTGQKALSDCQKSAQRSHRAAIGCLQLLFRSRERPGHGGSPRRSRGAIRRRHCLHATEALL